MRRAAGFTLLEILVALAVMALLIVLLDQGVAFGLRASAMQVRAEADGTADLPTVDTLLRSLVADADPGIFPEPASLKGTATTLSLLTAMTGADGRRERVDAVLFASGGQLRLRWTPHRHIASFDSGPPAQETTLLDGVSALRIDYAAPSHADWQPSWSGEALPALVRLRITFASAARHWPPIVAAPKLEALGQ